MARDDVTSLTPKQRIIFDRASQEYDDSRSRMRLLAYLMDANWDEDIAHEKMDDLQELMEHMPIPQLSEVRRFYETADDGLPPPCLVLLEDGKGDCARARDGSPVVVGFGALRGTSQEIIQQLGFVFSRVDKYVADTELPCVTFVGDLLARKGLHETQSPDMTVGKFMMKFPMSYRSYTCGVEPWMEAAMEKANAAARLMVSAETYQKANEKYKFSTSYDILAEVLDPASMLPAWHPDGSFRFDIPGYLAFLDATAEV